MEGQLALGVMVRVAGEVEHRPRAHAAIGVPRMPWLHRRYRVTSKTVVLHVVHDLEQGFAPKRTSREEQHTDDARHRGGGGQQQHRTGPTTQHCVVR